MAPAGRPGWRRKIEHCLRLDMRELSRKGLLTAGYRFSWRWTNSLTGEETRSIGIEVRPEGFVLRYSTPNGIRDEQLAITRTPCRFGGSRPWFVCPSCNENRLVLAYSRQRWACTDCHNLAYVSECLHPISRTWRQQERLERLLDEDWERPKGMWRKTHERLLDRLTALIDYRQTQCDEILARLLQVDNRP